LKEWFSCLPFNVFPDVKPYKSDYKFFWSVWFRGLPVIVFSAIACSFFSWFVHPSLGLFILGWNAYIIPYLHLPYYDGVAQRRGLFFV